MKLTLSWLKKHLDTHLGLEELCACLTEIGLEVEAIEDKGKALQDIGVAEIVKVAPHPNADKLHICDVKTHESKTPKKIICGAANVRQGLKVAFAPIGATIPANHMVLEKARIRGVESEGMLCSAFELGLGEEADEILELDPSHAVGIWLKDALSLTEPVISIGLTPNRPDCMGVRAIARELATSGLGRLKKDVLGESILEKNLLGKDILGKNVLAKNMSGKDILGKNILEKNDSQQTIAHTPSPIKVEIEKNALPHCELLAGCYIANVKNKPSPLWLQQALLSVDMNPINALVDITNYISYDRARPLHIYDADLLGDRLIARMAKQKESFQGLGDKNITLCDDDCVLATKKDIAALGGILGGETTSTSLATKNIFIESAWFHPTSIAKTAQRLGLITRSRQIFERGCDPLSIGEGLDLAIKMVLDICGGKPCAPVMAGQLSYQPTIIDFSYGTLKSLTGLDVPKETAKDILQNLGFKVRQSAPQTTSIMEKTNTPKKKGEIKEEEDQKKGKEEKGQKREKDQKREKEGKEGKDEKEGKGEKEREEIWSVQVPSFRLDVETQACLVEEIIRHFGVHHIASTILPHLKPNPKPLPTPKHHRTKEILAAAGMCETQNYSFIPKPHAQLFGGCEGLTVENPISQALSTMRPSLLPSLLDNISKNQMRGYFDLALFEVGKVFVKAPQNMSQTVPQNESKNMSHAQNHYGQPHSQNHYEQPHSQPHSQNHYEQPHSQNDCEQLPSQDDCERLHCAGVLTGRPYRRHWDKARHPQSNRTLFDAKQKIFSVLKGFGYEHNIKTNNKVPNHYHPQKAGCIFQNPKHILGYFGELHPSLYDVFDLKSSVVAFEIFLDKIEVKTKAKKPFQPSSLQPIRRDFAFEMDEDVKVERVLRAAFGANKSLISDVFIFDVFPLQHNKKSVGIEVVLQPKKHPLKEGEIDKVSKSIIAFVEKETKGVLRR